MLIAQIVVLALIFSTIFLFTTWIRREYGRHLRRINSFVVPEPGQQQSQLGGILQQVSEAFGDVWAERFFLRLKASSLGQIGGKVSKKKAPGESKIGLNPMIKAIPGLDEWLAMLPDGALNALAGSESADRTDGSRGESVDLERWQ